MPFSRELYIERDDFMEDPPKKFFRLSPGKEVRLRCAYFITCTEVVKDERGEIVELRCTYDPATRGGDAPDGRKVEGDAALGVGGARGAGRGPALRPAVLGRGSRAARRTGKTFLDYLNPHSLEVLRGCQAEPSLAAATAGDRVPVRAPGLLLRRSRFAARRAGVQPHRRRCATPGRGIAQKADLSS